MSPHSLLFSFDHLGLYGFVLCHGLHLSSRASYISYRLLPLRFCFCEVYCVRSPRVIARRAYLLGGAALCSSPCNCAVPPHPCRHFRLRLHAALATRLQRVATDVAPSTWRRRQPLRLPALCAPPLARIYISRSAGPHRATELQPARPYPGDAGFVPSGIALRLSVARCLAPSLCCLRTSTAILLSVVVRGGDSWCRRVIPDVSLSRRGASATLVYMLDVATLT